jgi:hypothetical protein
MSFFFDLMTLIMCDEAPHHHAVFYSLLPWLVLSHIKDLVNKLQDNEESNLVPLQPPPLLAIYFQLYCNVCSISLQKRS